MTRDADPTSHASATGREALKDAVLESLRADPKTLPCRFFYDEIGSNIFEEICELPEYYLTRAERQILTRFSDNIVASFEEKVSVVELGSGSAVKTVHLLRAFLRRFATLEYIPIDISSEALKQTTSNLESQLSGLEIKPIDAEYSDGFQRIQRDAKPLLILWLGSSIGNFTRGEAAEFLKEIAGRLRTDDGFLIGVDLHKDKTVLEPAYDDAAGVTARFNKNILARINRELSADFDLEGFAHRAIYNESAGRIEMYLDSLREQTVTIGSEKLQIRFANNEAIHTESSYKYTQEQLETLASNSTLSICEQWFDDQHRFTIMLLRV